MRKFMRFCIVLLALGIILMVLMSLGNDTAHPLELMEPVEPFDAAATQIVTLEQIQADRTVNVAIDGTITPMKLEDYVLCVVAAEMPVSFALEALKAQAVAARTFAIHKIMYGGCSKYKGADVCDDSGHCQAFISDAEMRERWKDNYEEYIAKLRQAVAQTRGKIITYDDEPILVLYHASSSGYTEDVEHVYSKALPYLRSVPSPDDGKVTNLKAVEEFDRAWFCSTVNKAYPKAKLTDAALQKQVTIANRYESGRVSQLKLGGETISGVQFRRLLDLRSANFTISFNRYSVIVTTEGYGHGVGMSQEGAQAMALEGSDYIDILTTYYTGVKIVDMK